MNKKYYLHINSANIAYYFATACVMPSKYFSSRIEDIQSRYPDYLLLSTNIASIQFDSSIELILTKTEEDKLIPVLSSKELFLLAIPLPISRVTGIYFRDNQQMDKIITAINLSTAFLPKRLANIYDTKKLFDYSGVEIDLPKEHPDFTDKISTYNSLLGGFAIMKLACEPYMNYSENYFSTLAYFNKAIEDQLIKSRKINSVYYDAFIGKDSFSQLMPFLKRPIKEEDINLVAESENQRIKKDLITGIIDLNGLERATYIVAVLYTYGLGDEGRKNKIDGLLINNFQKDIKQDRAEVVALCYGLNRGYSSFSNKYKSAGNEVKIKFELDSKVDYYTIESLYQYAINSVAKSDLFSYIDSWCTKYTNNPIRPRKSDYFIFDKLIIAEKTEPGTPKWWSKILQFFFQKNQSDLFKPFLLTFFDKVKNDIEDEYEHQIEKYEADIAFLLKENNDLKQSIMLLEKGEREIVKAKPAKERLSDDTLVVKELTPDYNAKVLPSPDELLIIQGKLDDTNKLLKTLLSHSKMADAKKLIKDYFDKQSYKGTDLYDNK